MVVRLIRGKEFRSSVQSGEKNLGRLFNHGKRTLVVRSIRGKEFRSSQLGEKNFVRSSGEKNLGRSFSKGKRT